MQRIRWLAEKIAESQRKIEKMESELPERVQRVRRLKKEIRSID